MLNVSNISKSYNAVYLFDGVTFNVGMGDRIALIGANGSGKLYADINQEEAGNDDSFLGGEPRESKVNHQQSADDDTCYL